MMVLMMAVREVIACSVVLTIISACALAFPTYNRQEQTAELETILREIRKELHMQHQNLDDFNKFSKINVLNTDTKQNSPPFDNVADFETPTHVQQNDIFNEDLDQFTAVKRQGDWDYDYGLGGGRFGKRAGKFSNRVRRPMDYFSYGGMGGRFGRDTEHAEQLDNDFYDVPDF